MDFFKMDFFSKKILLIFWGAKVKNRSAARVLSRPEARKKECIKFGKHFFELGMQRYTCATDL